MINPTIKHLKNAWQYLAIPSLDESKVGSVQIQIITGDKMDSGQFFQGKTSIGITLTKMLKLHFHSFARHRGQIFLCQLLFKSLFILLNTQQQLSLGGSVGLNCIDHRDFTQGRVGWVQKSKRL